MTSGPHPDHGEASRSLDGPTDDQLLDAWHRARLALNLAGTADYGNRMFEKIAAEAAAIERFGLGEHRAMYQRRFPDHRF